MESYSDNYFNFLGVWWFTGKNTRISLKTLICVQDLNLEVTAFPDLRTYSYCIWRESSDWELKEKNCKEMWGLDWIQYWWQCKVTYMI